MDPEGETALQVAEHRVREAEKHVAHFRAFVSGLHNDGIFADQAEDLLRQLEIALEEHRDYLAVVQAEMQGPGASTGIA
jgi:DNA-directed RNA polymerase specialized sigma54-like protein